MPVWEVVDKQIQMYEITTSDKTNYNTDCFLGIQENMCVLFLYPTAEFFWQNLFNCTPE